MVKILGISECNGKRVPIDYNYRKKEFPSKKEMDNYKKYLSQKLGKPLYFTFKDYGSKIQSQV